MPTQVGLLHAMVVVASHYLVACLILVLCLPTISSHASSSISKFWVNVILIIPLRLQIDYIKRGLHKGCYQRWKGDETIASNGIMGWTTILSTGDCRDVTFIKFHLLIYVYPHEGIYFAFPFMNLQDILSEIENEVIFVAILPMH